MALFSVARFSRSLSGTCRRCIYYEGRAKVVRQIVSPVTKSIQPCTLPFSSASVAPVPEPTITDGPRENVEEASQPWRVVAGICVLRMPSLSREKSLLALQHEEMVDQIRMEKSRLSEFELEQLEHERAKEERIEKALEDERPESEDAGDEADEFDDIQEARELELQEFKPAPRETEADLSGDMRSPNRKLDQVLYLLVKKPRKEHAWQLPQGGVEPGESLLEAAKREFVEECGSGLDIKFYSPTPHSVLSYRHTPLSQHTPRQVGSKVFFMKAFCYGDGDVKLDGKELVDHMWVTREEMQSYVSKQYYKVLRPILTE